MMTGIFDLFRAKTPILDADALAKFIDENSAFLVQKALYEYSRARAGHYAKVLFAEPAFHLAIEESRWRAFPLGLAMVTEVVDGVLRSQFRGYKRSEFDALVTLVLSVFDRYQIPVALGEEVWCGLRADLVGLLLKIGQHAPRRVLDIPEPFAERYFNLMPIHKKLLSRDITTTLSYLKVTLCHIHEDLTQRLEKLALPLSIATEAPMAPVPTKF